VAEGSWFVDMDEFINLLRYNCYTDLYNDDVIMV
jgi:hypothetical protein